MNKIFVKPKEGVKLRRPDNRRILSSEGEMVPNNTFWKRRLAEGDVVLSEAKIKIKKKSNDSSAEKKKDEVSLPSGGVK